MGSKSLLSARHVTNMYAPGVRAPVVRESDSTCRARDETGLGECAFLQD
jgi:hypothetical protein